MTLGETVTFSLVSSMLPLSRKIDALIAALHRKRPILEKAGLKSRVVAQLSLSQAAADKLGRAVLGNMALATFTGPLGSPLVTYLTSKFYNAIIAWGGDFHAPVELGPEDGFEREVPRRSSVATVTVPITVYSTVPLTTENQPTLFCNSHQLLLLPTQLRYRHYHLLLNPW
jgi:hypothetical protein